MAEDRTPVILNVDDTATSRLATSLILRQAGFAVVEAGSGMQALNFAAELPNLILLDVNLPDISGFEVCRRLKSDPRTSAIPVVHLSASYVTAEDRVAGLDEGADGYLTQPVQPRELVATIRAFLRLKKTEQALRDSETRYRTLFECSHDALILIEPPNWRITSGNPAALTMFGFASATEMSTRELIRMAPETQADGSLTMHRWLEILTAALRDGSHLEELVLARSSGIRFPASVLLTRIENAGQLLLFATVRDESDKCLLEANVAQADRLASMGMLAASMAHELNNPLAYVHYNVESLAQDLSVVALATQRCCEALRERVGEAQFDTIVGEGAELLQPSAFEDAADRAQEALDGTRRMKAITRELGMFSRVDHLEQTSFELRCALASAINLASNQLTQRACLVTDYVEVPTVWGSEGKLSQVFLNLLINATQAIEEGNVEGNRITVRVWTEGGNAHVEIADTGKGIPEEHLSRIFEPFFTTKPAGVGTGLGLAICKSIISQAGGDLRVESKVGQGTRVTVRLPIQNNVPSNRISIVEATLPRDVATVRGRVLVIDDEEALRRAIERLLGRDHELVLVSSGEEARALLEEDPAFDAILCDLMMSGMSGMALHAWLATRYPWLARQVLFITGGAFTPKASEYLASVPNTRLQKPFDSEELRKVIANLVREAHKPRTPACGVEPDPPPGVEPAL